MNRNLSSATTEIKLYKLLQEGEWTLEEIMEKLDIRPSTFYRCLQNLRESGFKIINRKRTYTTAGNSETIALTELETSLLAYLALLSDRMFPEKKTKRFLLVLSKILCLTSKETQKKTFEKFKLFKTTTYFKDYREKIELLEKYKNENAILKVTTTGKKQLLLSPLEFYLEKNRVSFCFLNRQTKKKEVISLDKIVEIIPEDRAILRPNIKETIFELYGKLAKTYSLKDEERVIEYKKDKIVVANSETSKEKLFRRLLRYDSLCKVLFPKEDVEQFRNLVQKALDNLDGLKDNK